MIQGERFPFQDLFSQPREEPKRESSDNQADDQLDGYKTLRSFCGG
jgi:hypothetical protein